MAIMPPTINSLLQKEGLQTSRVSVAKFIDKFNETGSLVRKSGSGRPSKTTTEIKDIVERKMREDDETNAYQLHSLLVTQGITISRCIVLCCRELLGWTFRGSVYCQLIRDCNKQKHLDWAHEHLQDNFDDVVWTDECSVQLETHKRFCCRKQGEPPRPKPRFVNVSLYYILNTYIQDYKKFFSFCVITGCAGIREVAIERGISVLQKA